MMVSSQSLARYADASDGTVNPVADALAKFAEIVYVLRCMDNLPACRVPQESFPYFVDATHLESISVRHV